MKKKLALGLLLLGLATHASAGFVGSFAPASWQQSPGDGAVETFTEEGLRISSGNAGDESFTDVGILVSVDGRISFDWTYRTVDLPQFDPFGISILSSGFVFTRISDNQGEAFQSGSFSSFVSAGQLFAFTAWTLDGFGGASTTTIGNFAFESVTGQVPEPPTLFLLAGALMFAAVTRRRRA